MKKLRKTALAVVAAVALAGLPAAADELPLGSVKVLDGCDTPDGSCR